MPELDTVRGIAVLLVLLYHGIAPPLGANMSDLGTTLFAVAQYGWTGVNVFFVLSGFLITGILLDNRARPDYFSRFYIRRALRILPALYAALLVLRLGGWISLPFAGAAMLFCANLAPLLGLPMQYGPLWSLAVEEHFYMVWPAAVRKLPHNSLAVLLAVVCLASPVLRLLRFVVYGENLNSLYTWFNADGLAFGAMLALWCRQAWFQRSQLKWFSVCALGLGLTAFLTLQNYPRTNAALQISACNLVSAGFLAGVLLLGTSRWKRLVDRPILKLLGYISYGLYLVHVLMFRVTEILFSRLWPVLGFLGSTRVMLIRFLLGSCMAILIAYLSRRSLEEFFLLLGFSSAGKGTAPMHVPDPALLRIG
jgi:peptidoglycan/LPS O-acetylase OafA/YrhL